MKTSKFTKYGLLIALALIMSYIEAQIPVFFAIPGIKLGLTNVVVLFALYAMDFKSAFIINIFRIILVGFMFGNGVSILFSLAGGFLSLLVMVLLKKFTDLKIITVSVAGGIAHNIGQIIVAMLMLQTNSIAWYLLVLWFTGIAAGVLVGIIGGEVVKRVRWEDQN
ncbi:MAG: Gx transporter family protein [Lachnospiraceae bacterium]|nr:Gx transporter family protein [Lachnospiraceae bacterium]